MNTYAVSIHNDWCIGAAVQGPNFALINNYSSNKKIQNKMNLALFSIRKLSGYLGVSAILLGFNINSQAQTGTLVAGWHFNTYNGTSSTINADYGTATIYLNGTQGSSTWPSGGFTKFAGSNVNGPGFLPTEPPAIDALALVGSDNNGKSIVLKFSMSGFTNLNLSFATRGTSSGFSTGIWSYSTDGSTWTNVGINTATTSTTFSAKNINGITGLNNASEAYLRYTLSGATGSTGNNRIDNIQLRATAGPLPIVLGEFQVTNKGSNNLLEWNSITEAKGDKFEIEHSLNGYQFEKIATINVSGNASKYSYTDLGASTGTNYYRLNLSNIDGTYTFSKIVSAIVKKGTFEISLFPNPAKDKITIATKGAESTVALIYISDITGKVLFQKSVHTEVINVDISAYPTGLYLLNYNDGSHKEIIKFTKGN